MSSHIKLHSGILFDPLNPDSSLITIEDIAYGLAGEYRWGGHSRLTVAQHSVMGSEAFGNTHDALVFLLHDASEGLGLRDIPAPVKHDPRFSFYWDAEYILMGAIGVKFGIQFPEFHARAINQIDKNMGRTEQFHLFNRSIQDGEFLLPVKWEVWSPEEAEARFLERYHLLTSPQSFTTGEYAKSAGMGRGAALTRLTKLEDRGIVERVKVKQNQGGVVRPNVLGWRFLNSSLPLPGERDTANSVEEVGSSSGGRSGFGFKETEVVVDGGETGGGRGGGQIRGWDGGGGETSVTGGGEGLSVCIK